MDLELTGHTALVIGGSSGIGAPDAAGRKVPVGDAAAFTNALSEVLANPHAGKRMGAAGRKYVRRFNWDELASRQETVYADVLAEAVPTGRPRRFAKAAPSGPAPADMVPESVPLATSGVLDWPTGRVRQR